MRSDFVKLRELIERLEELAFHQGDQAEVEFNLHVATVKGSDYSDLHIADVVGTFGPDEQQNVTFELRIDPVEIREVLVPAYNYHVTHCESCGCKIKYEKYGFNLCESCASEI